MDEALTQTLAALSLTLRLSLPCAAAALLVAVVVSLLQAWSRLTDPAISAIPRALLTLAVLGASGSWLAGELVTYARALFAALPQLAG